MAHLPVTWTRSGCRRLDAGEHRLGREGERFMRESRKKR